MAPSEQSGKQAPPPTLAHLQHKYVSTWPRTVHGWQENDSDFKIMHEWSHGSPTWAFDVQDTDCVLETIWQRKCVDWQGYTEEHINFMLLSIKIQTCTKKRLTFPFLACGQQGYRCLKCHVLLTAHASLRPCVFARVPAFEFRAFHTHILYHSYCSLSTGIMGGATNTWGISTSTLRWRPDCSTWQGGTKIWQERSRNDNKSGFDELVSVLLPVYSAKYKVINAAIHLQVCKYANKFV